MSARSLAVRYDKDRAAWGVYDPARRTWRGHTATEAGGMALRRNVEKWDALNKR